MSKRNTKSLEELLVNLNKKKVTEARRTIHEFGGTENQEEMGIDADIIEVSKILKQRRNAKCAKSENNKCRFFSGFFRGEGTKNTAKHGKTVKHGKKTVKHGKKTARRGKKTAKHGKKTAGRGKKAKRRGTKKRK